jgi:hypothetical protein
VRAKAAAGTSANSIGETRVRAAVHALYRQFARYTSARSEGCPCCVDAQQVEKLHGVRLQELSADALRNYARSALSTWGTLQDFKHFLPRILEHYACGAALGIDVQTVASKVHYEGPWHADELRAIADFLSVEYLYRCEQMTCGAMDAVDVFEAAGLSGVDVVRWFESTKLANAALPVRATALTAIVSWRGPNLHADGANWIWWKGETARAFHDWLLGPVPRGLLEQAVLEYGEHPAATHWSSALTLLEQAKC